MVGRMEPITITVTQDQLAAAFSKWLADYVEHPEDFTDLADETPREYGDGAAAHLVRILGELDTEAVAP